MEKESADIYNLTTLIIDFHQVLQKLEEMLLRK